MGLFQPSVFKNYLNSLDKTQIDTSWQLFRQHFHNPAIQQNILNAKEEEYQEGFVRDLFVAVLGYTLYPQPGYNFKLEKTTEADSTKSDGAIMPDGKVTAVIELKDTAVSDLQKIEKQAFGYKHRHSNCTYIITSNFQKLRFYISDAIEYEEWDLFRITKEDFLVLYGCLHQLLLCKDLPLTIKKASLTEEENVTRKLYADYSTFRKKLFYNIVEQNPQYHKVDLFKRTQKLLDRFLFILFAEDRLLLPPNYIRQILNQWQQLKDLDEETPLYDRFKKHFNYLNTGYQGKEVEVFAYNGGLFAPDEVLDNITISDSILFDSTTALSKYDFQSEVDVNILGHIFEHSLTELEELQAEAEGQQIEKSKTKRKKDGVFYTPRYITKYIVENTIGTLCEQKKAALGISEADYAPRLKKKDQKQLFEKLSNYRHWLLQVTICDPACGSGAFLNQALEFLIGEHRHIDALQASLFGDAIVYSDVEKSILENNLFGVDINDEAIEIARLSLWLRTAQKGRKLSSLNQNIRCGNSLIDDPAIAGDKAFNWQKEFPAVFEKGGFDVVIGNPPYGASLNKQEKAFFDNTYETTQYNYDTYNFFFEKSHYILKDNGLLSYITPNTFLVVELGDKLRRFLFTRFSLIQLFETYNVFDDAVVETIVSVFSKQLPSAKNKIDVFLSDRNNTKFISIEFVKRNVFSQSELIDSDNLLFNYRAIQKERLLRNKIKKQSVPLSDIANVTAGVILYEKGKGEPIQDLETLNSKPYTGYVKLDENWVPLVRGTDVKRYSLDWGGEFVLYGRNLAAPRKRENFYCPKLLVRRTDDNLMFTFDDTNMVGVKSVHCIQSIKSEISEKYLLAILNSRLLNWYFRFENFHMIGKPFAEVKLVYVERLPIIVSDLQTSFVSKADAMISLYKEFQEAKKQFLHLLINKYGSITSSKKLEDWPSLSFKDFIKELNRQKIKLTLHEEAEWLRYFEEQKAQANAIRQAIATTDIEIDQMVYRLYGLTEEEIKIAEGG